MPVDPGDWLPGRHLAWSVLEQARQMDLSAFGAGYRCDGLGGRPYAPAMMAGLLLYCYCKGLRSSRAIEMATFDDVGARVICGNLHPDHATIARFISRHAQAVCGLLPESVRACAREGLLSVDVVAGDGTKLRASASMAANMTGDALDAQIAELEKLAESEVRAWVAQHLAADDADATAPAPRPAAGPDADGPGDGAGLAGRRAPKRAALVLARRTAARAQLAARRAERSAREQDKLTVRAAELAARAERKQAVAVRTEHDAVARWQAWHRTKAATGRPSRGGKPADPAVHREVLRTRASADKARQAASAAAAAAASLVSGPAGQAKVNTTDWTSRAMPAKRGGFGQMFNVQALATAGQQVILAIMRHDNPSDLEALHPLLDRAHAVLDTAGITGRIGKALFDTGYASDANFTRDTGGTELYVAVAREAAQAGRAGGAAQPQTMLPSWQEMTTRLDSPEGRKLYNKRATTIEPVFAQLVNRLGRDLNYRGDLTDAELSLRAASHNLLKVITASAAPKARQASIARTPAIPATA
jgi:transposase